MNILCILIEFINLISAIISEAYDTTSLYRMYKTFCMYIILGIWDYIAYSILKK